MPSKPEVIRERLLNDPEYAAKRREYARKWREANRESERKRQRDSKSVSRSESREAYNAYARQWRLENRDRINAEKRERLANDPEYASRVRERDNDRYTKNPDRHRSDRLRSTYGISLEKYKEMYDEQEGKCAICDTHRPDKGKEGLVVDHCHTKGHVRKLLCVRCNTGLGQFRDDVQLLAKAIDYLKLTS